MKVLILGASGMLGHKLWQTFNAELDTYISVRKGCQAYARYGIFNPDRIVPHLDANDFSSFKGVFSQLKPDTVINCIGIIKQASSHTPTADFIRVNSLFPHQIADLCAFSGARLIQISTDCVFSGLKGMYTEDDNPDPVDLYGRSKLLGEVTEGNCLTIRTSVLGRELERSTGLLEWFLNQPNQTINGYTQAVFSGLTTRALSTIILQAVTQCPDLTGLYNISTEAICKHDLLVRLREAYQLDTIIERFDEYRVDRSLDSSAFQQQTGIIMPGWDEMIEALVSDSTPYGEFRR